MKKATVLLLILGLVSFCSAAITTYTLGPDYVTLPFDGILGQNSYTENDINSTIRQPAGLAFNSKGGLYVSDSPYTNNAGGRILYYGNASSNTPTSVLGATNVNSDGILSRPTSIAVYSANGTDYVLAVSSGGTGYSKYYNINGTNSGEGSDPIFNVVTSVGGPVSSIQAGNYLSLAIGNNPSVYFADTGNNRVVVQPNNSSAFPSTIYGTGSDGNAATCNTQTTTCFRSPTAVAVDCRQGVWMAVNAVNNVTLNAYGILYFPAGKTEATALYLPNRTLDFTQVFSISFNADCTKIAIAAVYRVYFGTLNLNYNPLFTIAPPEISRIYSIGAYDPNGGIPQPSADTDSLTTIQSVAFDRSNLSRLAIGDLLHNRVVFVNYNSSVVPSASRLANSSFSTSTTNSPSRQPLIPSFSSTPTASNNFSTTATATLGTSSTPSPNTTTLSTSLTSTTVPSSVALSSSSSSSNVPVGTPTASFTGTYTSISESASSESASPTTPSGTPTYSPTISYVVSYTTEPTPSLSYVPEASVGTGGAAVRIQSWVQLF